jgi:hypothetical protein
LKKGGGPEGEEKGRGGEKGEVEEQFRPKTAAFFRPSRRPAPIKTRSSFGESLFVDNIWIGDSIPNNGLLPGAVVGTLLNIAPKAVHYGACGLVPVNHSFCLRLLQRAT